MTGGTKLELFAVGYFAFLAQAFFIAGKQWLACLIAAYVSVLFFAAVLIHEKWNRDDPFFLEFTSIVLALVTALFIARS